MNVTLVVRNTKIKILSKFSVLTDLEVYVGQSQEASLFVLKTTGVG